MSVFTIDIMNLTNLFRITLRKSQCGCIREMERKREINERGDRECRR